MGTMNMNTPDTVTVITSISRECSMLQGCKRIQNYGGNFEQEPLGK
jgi:hypothetical protein